MTKQNNENQINETKQNILNAANKLMSSKGVKHTSLADIAKEVGISKGTLYYHYSSKDDLIFDIADTHLNQMTEELLLWVKNIGKNTDAKDILMVVFEKIISAETRGKLHLYLISDAVVGNELMKERFMVRYKEWRMTLEDGMRMVLKGKKVNHQALSQIIIAVLDGFTIQRMIGVKKLPLESFAELLVGCD